MRTLLVSTVLVGLLAAVRPAQAQAPAQTPPSSNAFGANASRYGMAIVDINYIFKNYPRMEASMKALQGDLKAADDQLKADRDRIAQMEEQRNSLKPATPEFKKIDEDLAREKADFSIKQGTLRRDFMEREAKIYYQTYIEVSDAVKDFAVQHNIGMVLRYNGDKIDPSQREDVMRAISQPIVHQNNIDITPDVLQFLLQRAPAVARQPAAPVAR